MARFSGVGAGAMSRDDLQGNSAMNEAVNAPSLVRRLREEMANVGQISDLRGSGPEPDSMLLSDFDVTVGGLPDVLEYQGEFGTEIVTFVPTIRWYHLVGLMKGRRVRTYPGMRAFYYFLSDSQYEEKKEGRKHYQANAMPAFAQNRNEQYAIRRPLEFHTDYRDVFCNDIFRFDKPALVIHSKYNNEWDNGPVNFISNQQLHALCSEFENAFQLVYFRQGVTTPPSGYSIDHNQTREFSDLDVLRSHPDVLIFDELFLCGPEGERYNFYKNMLYANCFHFVAAQGGGAHHCALFSGSILLVLHRAGPEMLFAYARGFYRHLANPAPLLLVAGTPSEFVSGVSVVAQSRVLGDRVFPAPETWDAARRLMPEPAARHTAAAKDLFLRDSGGSNAA